MPRPNGGPSGAGRGDPSVESRIRGPLAMTTADIDNVNRVFSDAFTERYHRDGMTGVRVPELNPAIWQYAMAAAGEGAMVWRDAAGVAAFNMVHDNGAEGWMGPLAVRPDWQGKGVGRAIVMAGVGYLKKRGCRTIGLETMPRTIDNIGFYSRMGFRPGYLTISLAKDTVTESAGPSERASSIGAPAVWLGDAHRLIDQLTPGLDFSRELTLTLEQSLGDVTVARSADQWRGFGLWHSAPLSINRAASELRLLKVVAVDQAAFRQVIGGVLREAASRHIARVALRCQTAFRSAFGELVAMGFRVQWTDLRMVLAGHEEQPVAGGVVFSNWEI
jgi:GNAT superfamily N-acetyltransferase